MDNPRVDYELQKTTLNSIQKEKVVICLKIFNDLFSGQFKACNNIFISLFIEQLVDFNKCWFFQFVLMIWLNLALYNIFFHEIINLHARLSVKRQSRTFYIFWDPNFPKLKVIK